MTKDQKDTIISSEVQKGHFEVGRQFHSNTYINFKKKYSDSKKTTEISGEFISKLTANPENFNIGSPTTFIGFRSYTGNLLSQVCDKLNRENYNCNYFIVESDITFYWQTKPRENEINENVIVVLPVSCTSSFVFKIKDFLRDPLKNNVGEVRFQTFINVFMIFDNAYKPVKKYGRKDISKHYLPFNWSKISKNKTITIHENDQDKDGIKGYTIYATYTDLQLSHECTLCFPGTEKNEILLHPYHNIHESTKLLDGYPKIIEDPLKYTSNSIIKESSAKNFKELFFSEEYMILIHGNVKSRVGRYNNFINANLFYKKNREVILNEFEAKINKLNTEEKELVFITPEGTNSSSFLEEIVLRLGKKNISILRFNPHHEFIDNFIVTNLSLLNDDRGRKLLIYFEEIMSGCATFKMLSDYIKHYDSNHSRTDKYKRHGFDYVITLIDRTALNIEEEILKKLYSNTNQSPADNFIKFFELNVPIFFAAHLENPIENEENIAIAIRDSANLDALKNYIIDHELLSKKVDLPYDTDKIVQNDNYDDLGIKKYQFDLVKLFCADRIYHNLSALDPNAKFNIEDIQEKIKSDNTAVNFFDSDDKQKALHQKLIEDITVKILTKHPFIHYKNIFEALLHHCQVKISDVITALAKETDDKKLYDLFWNLRFYIKRLVELNSKYILSDSFFDFLYTFYRPNGAYERLVFRIERDSSTANNINKHKQSYQDTQILTFSSFLLYCYKRLVYENYGTSIKLERQLEKHSYFNKPNAKIVNEHTVNEILSDHYYKFLDMLTLENIFPFQASSNNENFTEKKFKSTTLHNYDYFKGRNFDLKGEFFNWKEGIDTTKRLYEIIDAFVQNIKEQFPANTNFSFVYKLEKQEDSKDGKYYCMTSKTDSPDNFGITLNLPENGFISQFIEGITKNHKIQSYYAVFQNTKGVFLTYNRHYRSKIKEEKINETLNIDLEQNNNLITRKENVYLLIRLSEIAGSDKIQKLQGKGAIIISLQLDNVKDFFKITDSRKIRDLLCIRKDLLQELKKKTENESFMEILKSIRIKNMVSKFNHQIYNLYNKTIKQLQNSNTEEKYLYYPFKQVCTQLFILSTSIELIKEKDTISLTTKDVQDIFDVYKKLYFDHERAMHCHLRIRSHIDLKVNSIFRFLIIPELFWSMFKVASKQCIEDEKLIFHISLQDGLLMLSNPCISFRESDGNKTNGGLQMIKDILSHLSHLPIEQHFDENNQLFTTTIQIQKQ